MGHKAKALGYGGVEIYWAVSNGKSPVRFTSVALPEIIIKVDDNSDPSEIFTLERMESRKDERRVKMFRGGGFSSLSKAKDPTIQISFKKVRDKIYQVIFTSQLSEGEYAFIKIKDKSIDATQIKISAFGID